MNKLSRRRFVNKSLYLSAIPFGISLLPTSSFSSPTNTGVSDLNRITNLLKAKGPIIWVFTGDSITHGAKHTHGYRSYPEIFGERIRWELERTRDIVINTGISGNTTQSIISDFDWRGRQFKPTVVSLMIGTNDCSKREITIDVYEKNLHLLVAMIRESGAIPILHTPNVIIRGKAPERAGLSEYVEVIKKLAVLKDIILVDNYEFWQNSIIDQGEATIFKKWLNDQLHPNGEGHSQIARLMFKELSIFDPTAPTCGGPFYEGEH